MFVYLINGSYLLFFHYILIFSNIEITLYAVFAYICWFTDVKIFFQVSPC